MKILFLILLSCSAFADSDPLYKDVSYYTVGNEKFRMELANNYPKCSVVHRARKIYQHDKNELREIAIFRNGKMEEGGANNKPALRKEVDAIFARSQVSGNPCVKPVEKPIEAEPAPLIEEAPVPVPIVEPEKPASPKAILN